MAPSTTTVAGMTRTERDVLDHYKEGVGARTIGLRTDLELTDVQTVIRDLAGDDRTRAAALVVAYDREHGAPGPQDTPPPARPAPPAPSSPASTGPGRRQGKAAPPRRPRAAVQNDEDAPTAPTVVPVNLADLTPVDVPVTVIDDPTPAEADPAPPAALEDAAPADPLGAPAGAAAAAQEAAEDLPTVGHWSGARAPGLPIEACTHGGDCPVHPNAQSIHNFDTDTRAPDLDFPAIAEAPAPVDPLDGPTEALPDVDSFETLMAAVAGIPELAELAGRLSTLVDQLHDRYDRERQSRTIRGEAAILRRELNTRIALLARLADPSAPTQTSPAAAAAA